MDTQVEEKFRLALAMLQDSFESQLEQYKEQNSAFNALQYENESLRGQLSRMKENKSQLENEHNALLDENASLLAQRNALQDRCNSLDVVIADLNKFRSAICSVVKVTDDAPLGQSQRHAHVPTPGPANQMSFTGTGTPAGIGKSPRYTTYTFGASASTPVPQPHQSQQQQQQQQQTIQQHQHQPHATVGPSPPHETTGKPRIDAIAYYREVRQALPPADFRFFADEIRQLNSGDSTIDDTVQHLEGVMKPYPHLFYKLKQLLSQAAEDAL